VELELKLYRVKRYSTPCIKGSYLGSDKVCTDGNNRRILVTMNKAERAAYMRQYRAEKKRKSGQNTERVRRYRANHPEQTREYAREQKAEWRKQQKELAALNAPAEFVSSGTD